jgi:hypothetical protein
MKESRARFGTPSFLKLVFDAISTWKPEVQS